MKTLLISKSIPHIFNAMGKNTHEIRDPIHVFIKLSSDERRVLDSRPFQRLRYIHQLALTYLVYPGATHRRFEHSLGVMELAARIFDVVTAADNITDNVKDQLPQITSNEARTYWRRVVRMAALCHDIGHLPFSHAAEHELLPTGWDHERLTRELILSAEMKDIWSAMEPPMEPEHIVKLALGPKKAPDLSFSNWQEILTEIITGDVFGADRMDYLLRDAYHTGVAYGRFDHFRLIDTLRILPSPPTDDTEESSSELSLGIEQGGIQSAEALLLARYFMFTQVYFHPVRRVYDIHLKDFLAEWLPGGRFPVDSEEHLSRSDNDVLAAMNAASCDSSRPGSIHAERIIRRRHFKKIFEGSPDMDRSQAQMICETMEREFGKDLVKFDRYIQKGKAFDFPILTDARTIISSQSGSQILSNLPPVAKEYVFIEPGLRDKAIKLVPNIIQS